MRFFRGRSVVQDAWHMEGFQVELQQTFGHCERQFWENSCFATSPPSDRQATTVRHSLAEALSICVSNNPSERSPKVLQASCFVTVVAPWCRGRPVSTRCLSPWSRRLLSKVCRVLPILRIEAAVFMCCSVHRSCPSLIPFSGFPGHGRHDESDPEQEGVRHRCHRDLARPEDLRDRLWQSEGCCHEVPRKDWMGPKRPSHNDVQ